MFIKSAKGSPSIFSFRVNPVQSLLKFFKAFSSLKFVTKSSQKRFANRKIEVVGFAKIIVKKKRTLKESHDFAN